MASSLVVFVQIDSYIVARHHGHAVLLRLKWVNEIGKLDPELCSTLLFTGHDKVEWWWSTFIPSVARNMIIERAAASGGRQECYGMWIFGVIYFYFFCILCSLLPLRSLSILWAIRGPTRELVIFKFETREKYPTNLSPIGFFFSVCLTMTAVVCDNDDVAWQF